MVGKKKKVGEQNLFFSYLGALLLICLGTIGLVFENEEILGMSPIFETLISFFFMFLGVYYLLIAVDSSKDKRWSGSPEMKNLEKGIWIFFFGIVIFEKIAHLTPERVLDLILAIIFFSLFYKVLFRKR